MREFLKEKGIEPDLINEIMAEHGKKIGADKLLIEQLVKKVDEAVAETNTYKNAMDELEKDFLTAKDSQTELEALKQQIADKEQEAKELEEAKAFEEQFNSILGDRQFINEETKEMFITKFKNARVEDKTDEEVFNELVGERTDLFDSPNKLELPATSEVEDNLTDESRLKNLIGLE